MSRRRAACAALILALSGALPPSVPAESPLPAARPITLDEAYRLALKRSEQIAESREAVEQALARVDELRSSALPRVSLTGSETLQENPHSGTSAVDKSSLSQAQIVATQPLFSGFREFLAFKAGKKRAESASLDVRRAESLLYQDVVQAYLNLLQFENEIAVRRQIITATEERIKQLERWVKIGRSRDSELLAARSQLAQAEAQVEIARGRERVAQEALLFLTGLDEEALLAQDVPEPGLDAIEPFLEGARRRSDVQARERDFESARLTTKVFSRQRWPTIGVTGDYYLKRSGGFSANTHYDAVFAASLPLFYGGQITAQVRQARARERSAEQALSFARRGAERDVRSAFRNLEGTLAAAKALDKAARLADENVKAQAEDYKIGRVTNLEVLDSLNALQATRLTLEQTRLQAVLARAQLEVAAGGAAPSAGENP